MKSSRKLSLLSERFVELHGILSQLYVGKSSELERRKLLIRQQADELVDVLAELEQGHRLFLEEALLQELIVLMIQAKLHAHDFALFASAAGPTRHFKESRKRSHLLNELTATFGEFFGLKGDLAGNVTRNMLHGRSHVFDLPAAM